MTSTSAHNAEFEELAALYALRVLEGPELEAFTAHLAACSQCRGLARQSGEALAAFGSGVGEMEPSPGFKTRLMDRAAQELAGQSSERGRVIPFTSRGRTWRSVAAIAAALVLLLGGGALGGYLYGEQPLTTTGLLTTAGGGASVTVVVRRSGATDVELAGLGNPPPGRLYVVWIIGPDKTPVNAGASRSGAPVRLSAPALGRTVAVTVEQSAEVGAPTTEPILAGVVLQ